MKTLITLDQYKTLTNSAGVSTYDTLLNELISAASIEIENYCQRPFNQDLYIQWYDSNSCCNSLGLYCDSCWDSYHNRLFPTALPVKSVVYYGSINNALAVTNNSTTPYTFSIENNILTVTSNLSSTEYSLDTDFVSLVNTLTSAYSVSIVTTTTSTNNGLLLKPETYTALSGETVNLQGAIQVTGTAHIVGNEIHLDQAYDVVAYIAGYKTIPQDLQMTTANIVRDMFNIQLQNLKGQYKSETITNYSYTLADNTNLYNIVNNYNGQLARYRTVVF